LQGGMLSGTSFAVVVIDDKRPMLLPRFESFSYFRDGSRRIGVSVERHIHFASFIVDRLGYR
jgi:hypothetical protein